MGMHRSDASTRPVCVVIHDAGAPTWPRCERLWQSVQDVAPLPVTWLVVPRLHWAPATPEFIDGLHAALARGDELALHGYSHLDDAAPPRATRPFDALRRRVCTAGEGEFAAIDEDECLRRLAAARGWFARHRLPRSRGFVAPAWLAGQAARAVLMRAGFDYVASLAHIDVPSRGWRLRAPSLVYSTRAAWRRELSIAWNTLLPRLAPRGAIVRLELHPGDVEHDAVRRAWTRRLEAALRAGPAMTMADAVDSVLARFEPVDQDAATTIPAVTAPSAAPASTSLG